ncbi:Uncharacterized protein OS=Cystobacter violaceus Cb vi76 GN=Q664_19455 PE=4 SV=1 [Gemmata massiliana]|uniref:Poly A polymerase head domain-containing protein n=1 Tax=Gemmata massiliana TaxID=1210884 RepID=A0A6P2CV28_9BACT|nr:hypothetical protein [Gemmata massiliana]VTR91554.1 Uncharacterized protein OS=Cystobacter violaceus Cb vi76 GN=Q664_19455 PE=4 SV=1 [Gemmata massiliana]
MAEAAVEKLNALLWERIDAFLARSRTSHGLYGDVVHRLALRRRTAVLFGGALRDLMASGEKAEPRDLDLVLDSPLGDDLPGAGVENRFNRFGGRRLKDGEYEIDLWPLARTWAFHALGIGSRDFTDLPRTTFLNVEALAVRLGASARRLGPWDEAFFRGFLDRMVEVNLEDNPNPLGCVVRSLVTTHKLGFSMGPKLVSYIHRHTRGRDLEELVNFQTLHYGRVILPLGQLAVIRTAVRDHLRTCRSAPFRYFAAHGTHRRVSAVREEWWRRLV